LGSQEDNASIRDVEFMLKEKALSHARLEKVIHSSDSFHMSAYEARLEGMDFDEIEKPPPGAPARWHRGDRLPDDVLRVVMRAEGWSHYIPWFPKTPEMLSSRTFVSLQFVTADGSEPRAPGLIFVRPAENVAIYFGADGMYSH